jgi:pimeloyl-ACP methyl ester carboxylesterase
MPVPAPVIILVHGAGLNGASWNPVRRHIDPRLTVVTPDLPGHGARGNEVYTLDGAIATVAAAARAVYPAPVIIGGDSLGGYTCTAAASRLPPEQLKGCILSGSSANLTGFFVLLPLHVRKLVSRLSLALMRKEKIDRMLAVKMRQFGTGDADIAAMIAAGMHPRAFGQAVDAIRDIDFRAIAARITQPVLFVNGSKDAVCMRGQAAFVAAVPGARAHCFDDAEHGVSLNRSEGFAALVNDFALPLFGLGEAAA